MMGWLQLLYCQPQSQFLSSGLWILDLGLRIGTWIWDLDLGLDLGLTICKDIATHNNNFDILAIYSEGKNKKARLENTVELKQTSYHDILLSYLIQFSIWTRPAHLLT